MNRGLTLLGGIGLGAFLMYMFDPDKGNRRRALVRDKLASASNKAEDAFGKASRDLSNRAEGLVAETRAWFTSEDVPDEVLVERVRSQMGRYALHTGGIQVTAEEGRVTLRGPVLASEVDDLLKGVAKVRGVREVINQLDVREVAGDDPNLQGDATQSATS